MELVRSISVSGKCNAFVEPFQLKMLLLFGFDSNQKWHLIGFLLFAACLYPDFVLACRLTNANSKHSISRFNLIWLVLCAGAGHTTCVRVFGLEFGDASSI